MLTSCKRIAWQQRLKSIRSLFFFVFKLRVVLAILQIGNRHRRHKQRKITINKTLKKIREYLKGCIPAAQALCLGATGNLHHTHNEGTFLRSSNVAEYLLFVEKELALWSTVSSKQRKEPVEEVKYLFRLHLLGEQLLAHAKSRMVRTRTFYACCGRDAGRQTR